MEKQTWEIGTVTELQDIAKEVLAACNARTNDGAVVLALHGDLGAGKTTFVQQCAEILGVSEVVTSPTFVIMKMYTTSNLFKDLVHIDAYRIEDVDEMRVLGFEALLAQKDTIICIEWAERIASILPTHTRHLDFTITGATRTIAFT